MITANCPWKHKSTCKNCQTATSFRTLEIKPSCNDMRSISSEEWRNLSKETELYHALPCPIPSLWSSKVARNRWKSGAWQKLHNNLPPPLAGTTTKSPIPRLFNHSLAIWWLHQRLHSLGLALSDLAQYMQHTNNPNHNLGMHAETMRSII